MVSRWVLFSPEDERTFPEEEGEYLVTYNPYVSTDTRIAKTDKWLKQKTWAMTNDHDVIAWKDVIPYKGKVYNDRHNIGFARMR